MLVLSVSSENFLTAGNLTNVLRQVSINGILAVGMTFVILTGGIDLSIGSVLAFAGMVGASLVIGENPHAPITAVLAAMTVGEGLGACSGVLIAWVRLPAFVVTLGMLSAVRGLTLIYSRGMPISNLSASFKFLGFGNVFGVPVTVCYLPELYWSPGSFWDTRSTEGVSMQWAVIFAAHAPAVSMYLESYFRFTC